MSNTFKDIPDWVREKRNHTVHEVHIGCPYAETPRTRYAEFTTTTEMRWQQVEVTVQRFIAPGWMFNDPNHDDWWGTSTHLAWRYSETAERHGRREPYWVDVCDLDVRPNSGCHFETELDTVNPWRHRGYRRHYREAFNPDGTIRYELRRRREYDEADRRNARGILRAARAEWNAGGDTDLEPVHTLAFAGWFD